MSKLQKKVAEKIAEAFYNRLEKRIDDIRLFAQISYGHMLSDYEYAGAQANKVGEKIPNIEPITKAVYESWGGKWSQKKGSFTPSEAMNIAKALTVKLHKPDVSPYKIRYKISFKMNLPILLKLERGEISWDYINDDKLLRLLWASLRSDTTSSASYTILRRAIRTVQTQGRAGLIKHNPRPYFGVTIKSLVKEKTFLNTIIK